MIEKIACHLGRRDEEPNIRLAVELSEKQDRKGIAEIARGLGNKNVRIAGDCIKVLYEVGERNPALIADYAETFVSLLRSRNNRMVWGAAIALGQIAPLKAAYLFQVFDTLYEAYRNGSVITVDHCVSIFAALASAGKEYEAKALPVILEHLTNCSSKELAQHAERSVVCMNHENASVFKDILMRRYPAQPDAQKMRLDPIIKKIENLVEGEPVI